MLSRAAGIRPQKSTRNDKKLFLINFVLFAIFYFSFNF
jgi:hypothetical protein